MNGNVGVLPDAHPEAHRPQLRKHRRRIGITARVPLEGEARCGVQPGPPVQGDDVARQVPVADLLCFREQLVGVAIVGTGHDRPEAVQRRHRSAAGQLRVLAEQLCAVAAGKDEQVQLPVLDEQRVRALGPGRIADRVSHRRRGVGENAPASRAPQERRVLVGLLAVHAVRIVVPGAHELVAAVQPPPLFAEPVNRLGGTELETDQPALLCSRKGRQANRAPQCSRWIVCSKEPLKNKLQMCSYRRQTVDRQFPTVWRPWLRGNAEVISESFLRHAPLASLRDALDPSACHPEVSLRSTPG